QVGIGGGLSMGVMRVGVVSGGAEHAHSDKDYGADGDRLAGASAGGWAGRWRRGQHDGIGLHGDGNGGIGRGCRKTLVRGLNWRWCWLELWRWRLEPRRWRLELRRWRFELRRGRLKWR